MGLFLLTIDRTRKGIYEMTPEIIFGSVAAAGAIVTSLLGGGLLTRHIKQSNELAVTKYIVDETQKKLDAVIKDVAELQSGSVEMSTKIDQFTERSKKLDLIPALDAKLEAMEKLITSVQSLVSSIAQKRHA